ncbi:hypothetical protein [Terrabacter sp. C0L_2]|uniref:hypothetical protein n=1 Tax=Terrabacter sp. C0L_2 TaxID=3108389 RepID=UPI002ED2B724|nr:hypothetical protein U5C87_12220 [Terrabacter sp. C0L_2]
MPETQPQPQPRPQPTSSTPVRVRRTVHFGAGPEWSLSQVGATLAATGGVAVFLASLFLSTGGFDAIWWALVLLPLVTMTWAGSAAPLAYWGLLLFGWFILTPAGSFSWWSLPAAAGCVVGHAATALSASAPPAGSFAAPTARRWLRHTAIAFAAAVPVAVLAGLLAGRSLGLVPAAYVIGLGGVAVGLWMVRTSPPVGRP